METNLRSEGRPSRSTLRKREGNPELCLRQLSFEVPVRNPSDGVGRQVDNQAWSSGEVL